MSIVKQIVEPQYLYLEAANGKFIEITKQLVQSIYQQQTGNARTRKTKTITAIENLIVETLGEEIIDIRTFIFDVDDLNDIRDFITYYDTRKYTGAVISYSSNENDLQVMTINGVDKRNNPLQELLNLSGTMPVSGNIAFDQINSISLNQNAIGNIKVQDQLNSYLICEFLPGENSKTIISERDAEKERRLNNIRND